MIGYTTVQRVARSLEVAAVSLAVGALLYRATAYWLFVPAKGEPYGVGDIIDFALAMLLFLVCGLCAAAGVASSMSGDGTEQHRAFRPAVIGITSFVVYYFLHPHVPRLL
ncbi:MAG: hypothetical protein ACU85U_03295 [Gammaproteobacteria bacterium]